MALELGGRQKECVVIKVWACAADISLGGVIFSSIQDSHEWQSYLIGLLWLKSWTPSFFFSEP